MPKEEFIGKNLKSILPPTVFEILKNKTALAISTQKLQVAKYDLDFNNNKSYFEA